MKAKGNPAKGPKHERMPDKMLRRAIRGMLPHKKAKGREAFKKIKVFIGIPEEYANAKLTEVTEAEFKGAKKYCTLGEISKLLGAKW
jgi:ribosomal protein uL13